MYQHTLASGSLSGSRPRLPRDRDSPYAVPRRRHQLPMSTAFGGPQPQQAWSAVGMTGGIAFTASPPMDIFTQNSTTAPSPTSLLGAFSDFEIYSASAAQSALASPISDMPPTTINPSQLHYDGNIYATATATASDNSLGLLSDFPMSDAPLATFPATQQPLFARTPTNGTNLVDAPLDVVDLSTRLGAVSSDPSDTYDLEGAADRSGLHGYASLFLSDWRVPRGEQLRIRAETQFHITFFLPPDLNKFEMIHFPRRTVTKPKYLHNGAPPIDKSKILYLDVAVHVPSSLTRDGDRRRLLDHAAKKPLGLDRLVSVPEDEEDKAPGEVKFCDRCLHREKRRNARCGANKDVGKNTQRDRWMSFEKTRNVMIQSPEYTKLERCHIPSPPSSAISTVTSSTVASTVASTADSSRRTSIIAGNSMGTMMGEAAGGDYEEEAIFRSPNYQPTSQQIAKWYPYFESQNQLHDFKSVSTQMRIACYARHQGESSGGFQAIFTLKTFDGKCVAQAVSEPIYIVDANNTRIKKKSQ